MRAMAIRRYGGPEVLEPVDLPTPMPGPTQVLVRIQAASVNPVDWKVRQGQLKLLLHLKFPAILGSDFAGEVVQAGSECRRLKKGDRVCGFIRAGLSGTYAEYAAVDEDIVATIPDGVTNEQGAAIGIAALTALQSLRDLGGLWPNQRALIIGASGGVGTFAVQIAKLIGAHVTAVTSAKNVELVKSLGADEVVDYTTTDVTLATPGRPRFNVILDAVSAYSFTDTRFILADRGTYVRTLPSPESVLSTIVTSVVPLKKSRLIMVKPRRDDLEQVLAWIAEGKLKVVIDRSYKLEELAEAHRHSETGRAKGKILITI